MAIKIIMCPRCGNLLKKKDTKCSQCGLSREKIENMENPKKQDGPAKSEVTKEKVEPSVEVTTEAVSSSNDGGVTVNTKAILDNENSGVLEENNSKSSEEESTNNSEENEDNNQKDKATSYEHGIDSTTIGKAVYDKPKRHKHKSKAKDQPQYTVDENGEYNIDTSDVTYLEGVETPTYSVKKARGEVTQEKIKWWEIYKWADRMLARRKINKEVNKAATATPVGISRVAMIIYCLLFGWLGIHNFYAHNFKRGWFVLVSFVIVIIVTSIDVLIEIMGVFVGGGLGFVVFAMWMIDLFSLFFGKYKYRISKEQFISNLNVETRAKLGKKYIALDKTVFKAKEEKRLSKLNRKNKKKIEVNEQK